MNRSGVLQVLRHRRPEKLEIDEEGQPRIQAQRRQPFVDFVEQHHVPIRLGAGAAGAAFADVVVVVRQPDVQDGYIPVVQGVIRHFIDKTAPRLRIGIAQMRVQRNAAEKRASSVHLRQQRTDFRRHSLVLHRVPSGRGIPQTLAGPAVADLMVNQSPLPDFRFNAGQVPPTVLQGVALRWLRHAALVCVPAFEKGVPLPKLDVIGVESVLGQPVHHIQHIFHRYRAFDADAAVAQSRPAAVRNGAGLEGQGGENLAVRSRGKKAASQKKEKAVNPQ